MGQKPQLHVAYYCEHAHGAKKKTRITLSDQKPSVSANQKPSVSAAMDALVRDD